MSNPHPASEPPQPHSLIDLFTQFADSPPEFLQYDNGYRSWRYTYVQVGSAARNFAARLRAQGIGKGEKVIFWSENRPEWVAAFWGCVLQGVIVVPIDYRATAALLRRIQEIVSACLILIGEEVKLPPWEGQPPAWRLSELEWSSPAQETPPVPTDRNDIAEIVFTSGATGDPKGVVITHGNILANLVSPEQTVSKYRKLFRPVPPLRFLSLIPLSHMFGQALTMFILPMIPGVAVFMRGYSPQEILRQIRTRRISVLAGVPKILEVLREDILRRFPEAAQPASPGAHWILRWWQYRRIHWFFGLKFWAFIVGAAPLGKEVEEFWSRLGFAVIQGYGLTETAPIVAFNNPFAIKKGSVGKTISGIELKIAPDGEILVRGESVTPGYFQARDETARAFEDGWFHTGDVGELDAAGNLTIRGRKKEMIVTPEGMNVFPEDVEHVLNETAGVRESAVVGRDRVQAVLVLEDGANPDEIVRRANSRLEDHQKIRSVSVWPGDRLPRTEGTQKLKHGEIRRWVESGQPAEPNLAASTAPRTESVMDLVRKYAPGRTITPDTTLDDLGLSSLDRVQLMVELEQHLDTSVDESLLTGAHTVGSLAAVAEPAAAAKAPAAPAEDTDFPAWNRSWPARIIRRAALAAVWAPFIRMIAPARISGREHLASLQGPVIFASNHQSHLDTLAILAALPARFRNRAAAAMWKEYFDAHFYPERHTRLDWLLYTLAYWFAALFFNAFPLPQTETGARQSLRYLGELVSNGWSILFFPEGGRSETEQIEPFQPGIGLIASRLRVPVVPIRLRGLGKVLHRRQHALHPGRIDVTFGPPMQLNGDDYPALARRLEEVIRGL